MPTLTSRIPLKYLRCLHRTIQARISEPDRVLINRLIKTADLNFPAALRDSRHALDSLLASGIHGALHPRVKHPHADRIKRRIRATLLTNGGDSESAIY